MEMDVFEHSAVPLLDMFGIESKFWVIHTDTILFTWISMAIIFGVVLLTRFYLKHKSVNSFSFAVEQCVEMFVDLCQESFGFFRYDYFVFIASLFTFTMFCNFAGMLPFVKEPTEDLNTALACGVSAFLYVQYQKIRVHGFGGYFKEYLHPIFLFFPINVVGECAKAASMSFRLFGNILGGSIITAILLSSVEHYRIHFMVYVVIALPLIWLIERLINLEKFPKLKSFIFLNSIIIFFFAGILLFFGLFEGVIQAFVITMLTTTYLSLIHQEEPAEHTTQKEPHANS